MNIVQVPHPPLREKTKPVEKIDAQLMQFLHDIASTLEQKRNPRGVGLSAPQVDTNYSAFVTYLSPENAPEEKPVLRTFINPQIIKTSAQKTFGEDPKQPILEGCLSIQHLYGPVPRFEWVELEYQTINNNTLESKKERFNSFAARVMQHEFDHLQGILFTDYILEFELPLYDDRKGKLREISSTIAESF